MCENEEKDATLHMRCALCVADWLAVKSVRSSNYGVRHQASVGETPPHGGEIRRR